MNAPIKTEDYYKRKLGEASASALKEFRVSPLHYWHWVQGSDRKETEAMHLGTAFHMALHEPERFARRYFTIPVMPLRSVSDKVAFLEATCGACLGCVPEISTDLKADQLREAVSEELARSKIFLLTDNDMIGLRGMLEALNQPCNKLVRGIVARGKKELPLRWKDEETGVECKARIDSWDEESGVLSDLKRAAAIMPREFRNAASGFGYHYQAAFYRRALRANGADPKYTCFTCGSPEGPVYPWAIYDIPEDVMEACDARISADLRRLAECIAANEWPTINNGQPVTLQLNAEYI